MSADETTILVKQSTRDQLKLAGYKGQTYDDIINELLKLKAGVQKDPTN